MWLESLGMRESLENREFNQRKKTMKITAYVVVALVCTVFTLAATAADRPNIIVMMVDDMGFAGPSIAPYGNPNYKTPGMDRLAREGMLFTDFHSSGAVCSPTRAGLLTGRYQQRAGIEAVIHPRADHPEHRKGLHEDEITFAELFKDAGYATGLVGKWHLGYAKETPAYHPMNHGFDYFMGYVSGNVDYINHWGDHLEHDWWHGRKETVEEGYTTHLINRYALEFIEQNRDRPFCLYVAHESPHAPVQGPNDPIQRGPGAKKRTTPEAEAMKQMILEMDKGVEQARAKLVELGLDKNTLFLFFSDNGDAPKTATGSPRFRGHKGSAYEGGTRVPTIAWWPGKIKPGTRAEDLSITLDVMPTILSVADIAPPKNRPLDGVDLSPVLFDQNSLPHRSLFWANMNNRGGRSEAMRDDPWKLVVQHPKAKPGTFENETVELYNLAKDEGETTNLAGEHPERAAAMLKCIKDWYSDTQKTASPQPGGWLDPQYKEHVKQRAQTNRIQGRSGEGRK
jgi:arylsulfatase A-like enzyme